VNAAPITARILADSINEGGDRLTTFEWSYPRMIHSEIMTHKALAKNSASSRAIPAKTLRERTLAAPAYPGSWGANQKGMQAAAEVADTAQAEAWWLAGLQEAADLHALGERMGLHKQVVNRVIEPWMTITIVITGDQEGFGNLFHQRKHKDAEPSFQKLATAAWDAYHNSLPVERAAGDWHLPLVDESEREPWGIPLAKRLSAARCARTSYLTHEGKRDPGEDLVLHDRLLKVGAYNDGGPMHLSPFEHPCMAAEPGMKIGPFRGWKQYRKFIVGEAGPDTSVRCLRCGCWGGRHVTNCPKNVDPVKCNEFRSCGVKADLGACDCGVRDPRDLRSSDDPSSPIY
jgi:hypothetical protein